MPGSQVKGRGGLVPPGQEFSTVDDENDPLWERPRAMWIPKDEAAKTAVAKRNREHPEARVVTKRLNLHNLPPHQIMPDDLLSRQAATYAHRPDKPTTHLER